MRTKLWTYDNSTLHLIRTGFQISWTFSNGHCLLSLKKVRFFGYFFRKYQKIVATEMLVAILNTCAQEDPEEIAEEVKKIQMDQSVPEEKIEEELDDVQRRREIIKNKIRAVGKVVFAFS